MKLEELKFYKWIEKTKDSSLDDMIFIIDINSTSSPGTLQCWAFEMKNIKGDMKTGRYYNYKYEIKDKDKYDIKKLSIDDVDKSFFFKSVFDGKLKLN